jgi:hypothetical protein
VGGEICFTLGYILFIISQFTIIKAPIDIKKWRRFDNKIAHWSMPVGQFFRNLKTRRAFIAAFTSDK